MIERFQNLDWGYYGPELLTAVGDTLYMVGWAFVLGGIPVSYTHLTLPTKA